MSGSVGINFVLTSKRRLSGKNIALIFQVVLPVSKVFERDLEPCGSKKAKQLNKFL